MSKQTQSKLLPNARDIFASEIFPRSFVIADSYLPTRKDYFEAMTAQAVEVHNQHLLQTGNFARWVDLYPRFFVAGRAIVIPVRVMFEAESGVVKPNISSDQRAVLKDLERVLKCYLN